MTTQISDSKIEEALRKTRGNCYLAAKKLGCTRQTIWFRCKNSEYLQEVLLDSRESRIDLAEGMLDKAVLNGEGWAISLTLKTIGKNRGYIDKQEIEHSGEVDQTVIILPANSRMNNTEDD